MVSAPLLLFLVLSPFAVGQAVPREEDMIGLANQLIHNHVGSQEYASDLYDVMANHLSALSRMPPKSLQQKLDDLSEEASYNVSERCMNDTLAVFNDISSGQLYAVQMLDAWFKPPPGITGLNLRWMGAYDLCLNITKAPEQDSAAQYCALSLDGLNFIPANVTGGQEFRLSFDVCVPSTCSETDVQHLMNAVLSVLPAQQPLSIHSASCSSRETPYTAGDVVAFIISGLFLLLALAGTLFDVYLRHALASVQVLVNADLDGQADGDGLTADDSDGELLLTYKNERNLSARPSTLHKFLLAFSFLKNADKIWDVSNTQRDIQVLHGLRSLSMWWVILGHTHAFYAALYDNFAAVGEEITRWSFQAIGNATFSVDTFFFLSGLLVTFLTLKYMRANDGKMRWGMFYLHRYLRLTPVYMFVLMVFTTLFMHLPRVPVAGSMFDFTAGNTCTKYWWANLLYINNFVPLNNQDQCFGWAWYLANDMQFFVISPVIIIALYWKPRLGIGLVAVLSLLSMGVTGFIVTYFGQTPLFVPGLVPPQPRHMYANAEGFDYLYAKPYTRISTYLVGMLTGYVLYRTECKKEAVQLKKIWAVIGWLLAWVVALAVLYGFSYDIKHRVQLSYDVLAFYAAVSRFAWSLSLAWLTIACVHGYGGPITSILEWKCWVPISRLTYCAYLVHPIWMVLHGQLMRKTIHYDVMTMVYIFIGNIVLSYAVAFVVSVLVEAPLLSVEKMALAK